MNIVDIVLFGLIGAILGFLGAFLVYITYKGMYPHELRILQRVHGNVVMKETAARVYKNNDGNRVWVLANKKIAKECPFPPDTALKFNDKGKFMATCYMDDIGQVVGWVQYDEDGAELIKGKKTNFLSTKTLTAEQRSFYLREFRQAEAMKGNTLLQTIANLAPMFILGLVVIMGLIFAPDALNSYKEVQASMQSTANTFNTAAEKIAENTALTNQILLNKQKIEGIAPPDLGLNEQNTDKGD